MFESWLGALFGNAPFLASLLAGILSFLSPCILPLLPAYFSYISGHSIQELRDPSHHTPLPIISKTLGFILGFCSVFILLSLFLDSTLGSLLGHPLARTIAGGIICVFGLQFLGILRIKALYQSKRLELKSSSLFSPFLLGMSFSLGWSPCVGPILASILTLSLTQKGYSLTLILLYCLGLALPFLLCSLFLGQALRALKALHPYLRLIEILSGLLLLAIGISIAFDRLHLIADWITP